VHPFADLRPRRPARSPLLPYTTLFRSVGGWQSMKETVTPEYLNMWRSASDPDFPWPTLLIASTITGIWYWCTDQYIVQRALTARSEEHTSELQARENLVCRLQLERKRA